MDNNISAWLEEADDDMLDDFDPDEDDSDGDVLDNLENSDESVENESDSEMSCSDNSIRNDFRGYNKGKDNIIKWYTDPPPRNVRTPHRNIVTHLPGVKSAAKNAKTIIHSWELFFPNDCLQEITTCTNIYLAKIRDNYQRDKDVLDTDVEEIRALIGLLYIAGMLRNNHINLSDLWANDGFSPDIFRAVMSERRFYLLLRALRFDNIHTRNERKKIDNLAPIRTVFDEFVNRCISFYTPGEYCTIDEMLEGFRGRCKFRQYIANKPNKYGIKIFALVDSRVFYTVNMEIYAGKQPIGPFLQNNSGASVVKRMIKPIAKTGRNITIDNWFTSVPLAVELLKDYKTTMVGTLKKNKREIPTCFLDTKNRQICSTKFGFGDNNCLLLSYVPKKGKNVMMLSTMHTQGDIDPNSGDKKLPEVISFYNMSKGGVDVVDELKGEYSVSRNSHRWPLTVFFSLLNIAGINSQIIYKSNTDIVIPRRKFLKQLGIDLCKPHMVRRQSIPTLSISLRQQITRFSGVISTPETGTSTSGKAKCSYCPKKENRYTVVIVNLYINN